MKKILIIFAVLLPLLPAAQDTEYFTADWKKTRNKDKATYFRKVYYGSNGQPQGPVSDYYMNGALQWRGTILSIDKNGNEIRSGWCTWFHPNGKMMQQSFYNQGRLDSTTYYWDENGGLSGEEDYRNNVLHGAWLRYYPNQTAHLLALYENGKMQEGRYFEYDEQGVASAVYPEFFNDPSRWTLTNGDGYSAAIRDKKISLISKTGNYRSFGYKYLPLESNNNFSIETEMEIEKGPSGFKSSGLTWGMKDNQNYDYFLISDNGMFRTGYVTKGLDVETIPWTSSPAIRTGRAPNQLKILKTGKQYLYAVNGKVVATGDFQPLMGNHAGVTLAAGEQVVSFTRFLAQQQEPAGSKIENSPSAKGTEWNISGSGILIDKNGLIATNEHVIKGAKLIEVEFTRGDKKFNFKAEVVKADAAQDLAILRITDPAYNSFKPASLPFGITTRLLDIGSGVFALGYPEIWKLGTNIKFTDGKVSAQTGTQDNPYWYQITVPIQHGNSGGPLFDNDGNLVGLTNAGFFGDMMNVAYAIKSELLVRLIRETFPGKYSPPVNTIRDKPLTEKIKTLKGFVALIRAKA